MSKIILNIKNKQFIVSKGSFITVDKLSQEIGEEISFESVMMIMDNNKIKSGILVGNPFIKGIVVKAKVISHIKDTKIRIIKFRRRKHYKLTKGHRQSFTKIHIQNIEINNF